MLAGVSVDYYVRLERGDVSGASPEVLAALARTLRLDPAETAHLDDLARAARRPVRAQRTGRSPAAGRRRGPAVGGVLHSVLEALGDLPAVVADRTGDVVATNLLGAAFYAPGFVDPATGRLDPARPFNTSRFIFVDPAARTFYRDWDVVARDCVGMLRAAVGRDPLDPRLTSLVGELSTRSAAFSHRWAAYDVRAGCSVSTKRVHHPVVGDLDLAFEGLAPAGRPDLNLVVYTAAPGSPGTRDALALLAAWAGTTAAPCGDVQVPV